LGEFAAGQALAAGEFAAGQEHVKSQTDQYCTKRLRKDRRKDEPRDRGVQVCGLSIRAQLGH